ncbi:MAG TPA: hypothetical protein VIJ12_01320 [Candidatus Baltobacteraceae bacterium]
MTAVLGVDPGTRKVGYALVDADGTTILRGIEGMPGLLPRIGALAASCTIEAIALGGGTNVDPVRRLLEQTGLPVHLVDEHETTLEARGLYFRDHPPAGWRRLLPLGLQLPPRPIDDYAAELIARRWLALGNR